MKKNKKNQRRQAKSAAALTGNELEIIEQIRALRALPMNKRTNFLRQREPLNFEEYKTVRVSLPRKT
jgi:hypothetical protein